MEPIDILYHGEIQILGWGETRNQGKYLKIRLWDGDGDPLEAFRGMDIDNKKSMHVLNATISRGDILQATEPDLGKLASNLYRHGFFYNPKVLAAIGTDKDYREWIQKQPSAISGEFSEYVNGEGRCEAAHVRRAGEAGTGYKPPYSCIPLTHEEHAQQHQHGESVLAPSEWWEKARAKYIVAWAKETLLKELGGYDGFREVPPEKLMEWAKFHEIEQYLPSAYHEQVPTRCQN